MYKLLSFAAFITVARAGNLLAPAFTYSATPLAFGAQHQSVVRSLDGDSAVSHYSKAVDTAFSSVRKYDTRVTNDAKLLAPAAFAYAAPAAPLVKAVPAVSYAAPIYKAAPALSYAAPALSYAAAAPIYKTAPALSYAAPALSYAAAAPIYKAAPAFSYAAAAPIYKAAPALSYAAAPIYKAAPALSYTAATPVIKAAPALSYAAPAYGYQTYAPGASYVAHTTFSGLGAHYAF